MAEQFGTFTDGKMTITSTTQTSEQMKETMKAPETAQEPAGDDEPSDSPIAAPEHTAELEKPVEQPKKGNNGWKANQERMLEATRKESEAKKEAARIKSERDEIERRYQETQAKLERLRKPKDPEKAPEKKADGRPKEDDFDNYDEYVEALADWKYEQRKKADQEASKREESEKTQKETFLAFQKRIKDAVDADPTLNDRVSDDVLALLPGQVDPKTLSPALREVGKFLTTAPDVVKWLEHLTANQNLLQELAVLHPAPFWMKMQEIKSEIAAKGSGAATTATTPEPPKRAHAPVRPVTSGATSVAEPLTLPDASLSPREWGKQRERLEEQRAKAARLAER